jgi:hypothetical protein
MGLVKTRNSNKVTLFACGLEIIEYFVAFSVYVRRGVRFNRSSSMAQQQEITVSTEVSITESVKISAPAARVAIAAAVIVLLLLASLHVLSPEFDPSWRVVSEYANGSYGWVLSLMFASWALSSWALVIAVWSQLQGIVGKISLGFLIAAGVGEAMAAVFDINHRLHDLAGMIGVLSLPIAAMLISIRLGRAQAWAAAKKVLLWTANFTWASLLLMVLALIILMSGHVRARYTLVGWTNRLLVVIYCVWVLTVAWQALKRRLRY